MRKKLAKKKIKVKVIEIFPPEDIIDVFPPLPVAKKVAIRIEKKKINFSDFWYGIKRALVKIACWMVIVSLNWFGLSAVISTFAYLNDIENSSGNSFTAGTLDFELNSESDFLPVCVSNNEPSTRTITFLNNGNIPKYKVRADNFSGLLCPYLNLEARLDGGEILYSGKLTDFIYGPVVFEEPDNWQFTLILPPDAPEGVQGEACQFNFIFFGSQIRNDLEFGLGFNDIEEITNVIFSEICHYSEIRSKGYWKNHSSVYIPHLPQTLGNEMIDTVAKVNQVFDDYESSMRNKLKGQLLAMKFNIAHFGIGDYYVESQGKTLNQLAAEADNLLIQDPVPPDSVLEIMKDILDGLNTLEQIKYCDCSTGGPEPHIVINEVYYDADSRTACTVTESDPLNEWVEIYNPTPEPVDISGWVIEDNGGQDIIPNSPVIPGNGFAVIAKNSSTWSFWNIPDSVIKITLGSLIGNGLANDGDRVILKDLSGNIVDQMAYEGDISIWNPAPPLDGGGIPYDLPDGHSLGRDPDGFDTDMADDFIDFSNPTPGALTNNPQVKVIVPNGGEIWYLGKSYNLQWLAVDPWGNSENLIINMWYSKDSGQSWFYQILNNYTNTGIYEWLIPNDSSLVSSKARIKVEATNSEGLTGWDMSDCDFCPPTEGDDIIVEEEALEEETTPIEETPPTETPIDVTVVGSGGGIAPSDQPSSPETPQEEIPTQEPVTPEIVTEENPETIIPTTTDIPIVPEETPVIPETPAVEEQIPPAILPEEITTELPSPSETPAETTPSETAPESPAPLVTDITIP